MACSTTADSPTHYVFLGTVLMLSRYRKRLVQIRYSYE